MTTRLTPNFTLEEFLRSDEAERLGLSNLPGVSHLSNIRMLALGMEMTRHVLEVKFRRVVPIYVQSGYRSPAVNAAVGGTPTSAHALGLAADFHAGDLPLADTARALVGALPYDQLIYEHHRCVHISFDPRLRLQVMTQRGGPGTPFEAGIVE